MARLESQILDKIKELASADGLKLIDLQQNRDLMTQYVERAKFMLDAEADAIGFGPKGFAQVPTTTEQAQVPTTTGQELVSAPTGEILPPEQQATLTKADMEQVRGAVRQGFADSRRAEQRILAESQKFGVSIEDGLLVYEGKGKTHKKYIAHVKDLGNFIEDTQPGFTLKDDLSVLNNEDVVKSFRAWLHNKYYPLSKSSIAHSGSELKAFITANMPSATEFRGRNAAKPSNAVSDYEANIRKSNQDSHKELWGFNFEQWQRTKLDLGFPDLKVFNKIVSDSFAKKFDSDPLRDLETRVYGLTKLGTGLRDPDILNIRLAPYDQNSIHAGTEVLDEFGRLTIEEPTAWLDSELKVVRAISNKGTVIDYNLGDYAYEVLNELRQNAIAEGRETLFDLSSYADPKKKVKTVSAISRIHKRLNPVVREGFKKSNERIYNRATGADHDFTMNALRKNIATIITREFGTTAANQILGHAPSSDDINLTHYQVTYGADDSPMRGHQDAFLRVFSESIGITSPQALFTAWRLPNAAENVPVTFEESPSRLALEVAQSQKRGATVAGEVANLAEGTAETLDQTTKTIQKGVAGIEQQLAKAQTLMGQAKEVFGEAPEPGGRAVVPYGQDPNINKEWSAMGQKDTPTTPAAAKAAADALFAPKEGLEGTGKAIEGATQSYTHLNIEQPQRDMLSEMRSKAQAAGRDSTEWADWQNTKNRLTIESANNTKAGKLFKVLGAGAKGLGVLGIVGGVAAAYFGPKQALSREQEEAEKRGETVPWWKQALRYLQMGEEVLSPYPMTTFQLEQATYDPSKEAPFPRLPGGEVVGTPSILEGSPMRQQFIDEIENPEVPGFMQQRQKQKDADLQQRLDSLGPARKRTKKEDLLSEFSGYNLFKSGFA